MSPLDGAAQPELAEQAVRHLGLTRQLTQSRVHGDRIDKRRRSAAADVERRKP